jgi:hypothetical protein
MFHSRNKFPIHGFTKKVSVFCAGFLWMNFQQFRISENFFAGFGMLEKIAKIRLQDLQGSIN